MFKYNNTHIFTGYLKQLLSSVNLPACKIYTREFAEYRATHGTEDPRVVTSFNNINDEHATVRVNYLKNNELCQYFWKYTSNMTEAELSQASWQTYSNVYYSTDRPVLGLTRALNSPGSTYDARTHEYLGDYLRFLRDYYNINLMSLYNCFNEQIYSNIYFNFVLNPQKSLASQIKIIIDAQDPKYKIYAIPVKLFASYTIALDCSQGIELFCGFYNTKLDTSSQAEALAAKTYQKVNKALFNQPFIYDKLDINYWQTADDFVYKNNQRVIRTDKFTRWDLTTREKDLKLFIKVPVSCKSSITILEGDYRTFNDAKYTPINGQLVYQHNHSILNFNTTKKTNQGDGLDLNNYTFKPISRLQLLAFNTGTSYPFADRLVEYLIGSAITPIDEIPDNIKRAQRVMNQNKTYFNIEGLWENKMQNVLYDYMINSGPFGVVNGKVVDRRRGYHNQPRSTMYDVLGYVDKDTEKLYASWKIDGNVARTQNSIQTVDIYDGLYDI